MVHPGGYPGGYQGINMCDLNRNTFESGSEQILDDYSYMLGWK